MPQLADHLSKTAPNIVAQMVDLVPDSNVASIERYNADIALTPEVGFPDWINREPLFRSSFSVIARKGNPGLTGLQDGSILPLDVYCEMSHVMFSPEGNQAAMGDEALAKVGKTRKMAMTVPFFSGVCRAVSTSDLVALVPSQLANHVAPGFGLSIFEPDFPIPRAQISAIWHKRSDENLMAKWMRQQIFDLMKPLDEG